VDDLDLDLLIGTTPRPDAIKRLLAKCQRQATALRRIRAMLSDLREVLGHASPFERIRAVEDIDAALAVVAEGLGEEKPR
jgi:hypothetical protein